MTAVHELPGTWTTDDLGRLLEALEVEGETPPEDRLDMVGMALQDLGAAEAVDRVLAFVFGTTMRPGVRQNLVPDLRDERPWEQFAEVTAQRGIFVAAVQLWRAMPSTFTEPDALRVELSLTPRTPEGATALDAGPDASLVARLIADAAGERCILNRLYADEVAGRARFEIAPHVIWHAELIREGPSRRLVVHLGRQWLQGGDLDGAFVSSAEPDEADERD